jgi:hypothetical protein
MDIEDYKNLDEESLKAKIRALSRAEIDGEFQRLAAQHALLCQRLEAIYAAGRESRFASIRPGGLPEIDHAIHSAKQEHQHELSLLNSFRELNRILLPFMDAYEERVLGDLKHMSKEELQTLHENISDQLKAAEEMLKKTRSDYRAEQNATGKLRLASLFKEAIRVELRDRFGYESE